MNVRSRLKKINGYLKVHSPLVWFEYNQQFLDSLRPWVSEEHYRELVEKGGEWVPERKDDPPGFDPVEDYWERAKPYMTPRKKI